MLAEKYIGNGTEYMHGMSESVMLETMEAT